MQADIEIVEPDEPSEHGEELEEESQYDDLEKGAYGLENIESAKDILQGLSDIEPSVNLEPSKISTQDERTLVPPEPVKP